MLYYRIPIHMEGWCGQHEFAERFPGYPLHPIQFIFDRLSQFSSIHWWKQTCDHKVCRKIAHELTSDFLSFPALDQLNKEAIRWIREASDYNGHYSVFYRCSSVSVLDEFLRMFVHGGEMLDFGSQTHYSEQVPAVERLLSRFGTQQFFIAISHDTEFVGIFGDERMLEEAKTKHEGITSEVNRLSRFER